MCAEKKKVLEVFSYRRTMGLGDVQAWQMKVGEPRMAPRPWDFLISCDHTPSAGGGGSAGQVGSGVK